MPTHNNGTELSGHVYMLHLYELAKFKVRE